MSKSMGAAIRAIFAMQTVEERIDSERKQNHRLLFDAEKSLLFKRQEIVALRKRQQHLERRHEEAQRVTA